MITGVAERDVQTAGVNLNPQYRYAENQPPVITGYQASNTVNVVVRDIAKLGRILDALVATGANQVNGPTFDIDTKDPVYDEARRAALDKARQRADIILAQADKHEAKAAEAEAQISDGGDLAAYGGAMHARIESNQHRLNERDHKLWKFAEAHRRAAAKLRAQVERARKEVQE